MKPYLLFSLDFPPLRGGVARYYAGLAEALHGDIVVLTEPHPLSDSFHPVSYRIVRRRLLHSWMWPHWVPTLATILSVRRHHPFNTVIVGNVLPLGYPALLGRLLFDIPYVVCLHGLDLLRARRSVWKHFWLGVILRHAAAIITNSEWTRSLLYSQLAAVKRPASVMYPCPTLPTVGPDEIQRFREQWDMVGKRLVVSVSRLVARKGHDMALTAFPAIRAAHPNTRYVIIGDGPERDRLQALANGLGIANAVVFTGALPDAEVSAALGAGDIFLLPTRSEGDDVEGFGLVFLEAAAHSVPAIAGDGGGVREAVIDGETGLLVDPRSPQAITDAVLRLLNDENLRTLLGARAKQRASALFTWERQLRSLCQP